MTQDPGASGSPGGQGPSPGPCTADADRVRALEQAIEEKEQLVTALTVQLEDVCERLDRLQRTGGDRNVAVSGMPRELVEEQRTVLEELQESVRRWEEMQAAAALGRIETQVAELRDLLVDRLRGGGIVADGRPEESDEDRPENPPEEAGRAWESMKSALLAEGGAGAEDAEDAADPVEGDSIDAPDWVEPPGPIDLSGAPDVLRQAVEDRDAYIVWLIRKLRWAESPRKLLGANAPEDVAARLAELEVLFDEKLRLAEIELSLERARLAREDARLRIQDEQLQKELRRVQSGQPAASQGASRPADDRGETESAKSRRWRRMLGIGGEPE